MSDEPQPIAAGLAAARAALEHAQGPPSILPPDAFDDDDVAALAEARSPVGIERMREASWRRMCPQRFHRATIDDLSDRVRAELDDWLSLAPRPNLVLSGPVGVGKTHAALSAARADWMAHGFECAFHPLAELLDMLRPGGDPLIFERVVDVERLVIDDLGVERDTDWTRERVAVLINRRWLEERPLIVTTNLALDEIVGAIGERNASRLMGGDAVVITIGGEDRRR